MIIETDSLSKHYGSFTALDSCNLEVHAGEIFGLLGPNGAGKTTLIRLLLGFLRPSAGWAKVDGLDCFRQSVNVRRRLAYLPAEAKLFRRMRGREVLRFFGEVRGDGGHYRQAITLAGRLDLDLSRRVALMSTGMRQKLALAATMSQDTPLVILDEPTANLDPNVRREVMKILMELRSAGRTVVLSSHVLPEIEQSCDRVVILRSGKLVHLQDLSQLRSRHRITANTVGPCGDPPPDIASRITLRQDDDQVVIETEGDLAELLPWITHLGLRNMTVEPFGLRSVYDRFHHDEESP